jgi:hypothetical protein
LQAGRSSENPLKDQMQNRRVGHAFYPNRRIAMLKPNARGCAQFVVEGLYIKATGGICRDEGARIFDHADDPHVQSGQGELADILSCAHRGNARIHTQKDAGNANLGSGLLDGRVHDAFPYQQCDLTASNVTSRSSFSSATTGGDLISSAIPRHSNDGKSPFMWSAVPIALLRIALDPR